MLLSIALAALVLGFCATGVYLPVARRLQLLDAPNSRSAHREVTPSSGGLAFVAVIILLLVIVAFGELPRRDEFASMIAALAVIWLVGAFDDYRPLPVLLRLSVFLLIAAFSAWRFGSALPGYESLVLPILALALTWLYNLYNFMDGIDGLAALQAVSCACGLLLVGWLAGAPTEFLALAATTAGACAGFLCWNWPPARLFMGDAGSLSAGFLLGWMGLWGLRDGYVPLAVWLLLMSPFLLDASVTLARRVWRRERFTDAHNQHLYQRLARHLGGHRPVVLGLLMLQLCWLLPLALLCVLELAPEWTFLALGLFPQLFLIAKFWRLQ